MPRKKKIKDPFAKREANNYENPIPSREYILDYLAKVGEPLSYEALCGALHLETDEQLEALRRRLIAMSRDGQILKTRKDKYALIDMLDLIRGRVLGHPDGHGFIIPEDGSEDVFLNHKQMRMVFSGDVVLGRAIKKDYRGRREAVIVRVLQRRHEKIVGRFAVESGVGFVVPDNKRITNDIIVPPTEQSGAKPGDVVTVEVSVQPTMRTQAVGKIVEVLGAHMAPGMETDVAIRAHALPHEWSQDVLSEANAIPDEVDLNDVGDLARKDLRDLPFVTIDGEDARDFDDAVFCQKKRTGYTLYVAIADVSHYVLPAMALDKEAYERGNSVYFPQRVIPMLPEKLSNGLCSLNPKVDRFVLVCQMNITPKGKMTRYDFYPAVIHSHERLTYTIAADILVERKAAVCKKYEAVRGPLESLFEVYKKLKAFREEHGAISFDIAEPKVIFDEHQKIKAVRALVRNEAHKLIEQCMLSANEAAAKFLEKNKWPGPFRVHPGPKKDKLPELLTFLGELGLGLRGGLEPTPKDYMQLLGQVEDRPDSQMIQTMLLRSLGQAYYSISNDGHFGLAFDAYTHFTSPIRRYPDLLVHRAIYQILKKKKFKKDKLKTMEDASSHCSMTERRADDATRDVVGWLKCEFMQDKLGETYQGIVSGVTSFGLFIELKDIFVEGLVHISSLENDYYVYDNVRQRLTGRASGVVYSIGDALKVQVVRVDLDQRQIDFELVLPKKKKAKKRRSRK